jgi:3-oxoacyl-[acyl-carrier-protein] synthase-3
MSSEDRTLLAKGISIIGTGSAVPSRVVSNEELEKTLPTSAAWIKANLGINERRIAAPGERSSDLGATAAAAAMRDAGITADAIDLLIVATSTPDRKAPSTACLIQNKLGIVNASAAFDVAAVCSGFLYAMTISAAMLAQGAGRIALIVGTDTFSAITDWTRRDAVFFGDGAGAVVLKFDGDDDAFFASCIYADGRGQESFTVPVDAPYFSMHGRDVYNTATKVLPAAILNLLKRTNFTVDDISLLIPHQPSIRILQETARIIGLPAERLMTNMDRFANTSAATVPILLDELNRAGSINNGALVAFAAVGSGWTWGASLIRWSMPTMGTISR